MKCVEDFLDLCAAAEADEEQQPELLRPVDMEEVLKRGPSNSAKALRAYLEGMDGDQVLKLQTLYYCGRDGRTDVDEFQCHLDDGQRDAIRTITSKAAANIGANLQNGIKLLNTAGVDLERVWG